MTVLPASRSPLDGDSANATDDRRHVRSVLPPARRHPRSLRYSSPDGTVGGQRQAWVVGTGLIFRQKWSRSLIAWRVHACARDNTIYGQDDRLQISESLRIELSLHKTRRTTGGRCVLKDQTLPIGEIGKRATDAEPLW